DAIQAVRTTMGATSPAAADPGSLRGSYALDIGHNLVHGSDAPETADFEIGIFFRPEELVDYHRDIDRWIGA
ncbi:MAG TPA: nucleoside-diphosphate kinase, partial [Chloroflexota bacterium]|nr:nucleoside-diphosphate kinase [Chloroflexota bacterium]